jgi:hypothetical protein
MPQLPGNRRSYDHRIREVVCLTGNPRIFQRLRIPRSTTASWLSRGHRSVVSLDGHHDIASVLDENEKLKRRTERQIIVTCLFALWRSTPREPARSLRPPRPGPNSRGSVVGDAVVALPMVGGLHHRYTRRAA